MYNKFILLFFLIGCTQKMVSFGDWKIALPSSYQTLLSEEGHLLQESRVNFKTNRYGYIPLEEFPEDLIQEIVSIEDRRFYDHAGVDFKAIIGSFKNFLFKGKMRGASTISMQTYGLLYPQIKKSSWYKLEQILGAYRLEEHWSKKEILSAYLNLASFGGETAGLFAASLRYYGKAPRFLNEYERLWLISALPSPGRSAGELQSRACLYGQKIHVAFDCQKLSSYAPKINSLTLHQMAHHALQQIQNPGVTKSTLNFNLQVYAQKLLDEHLLGLKNQNVKDGAILVVEKASGHIKAYIGGSTHGTSKINHISAPRQAGSTLKPFLYAQAIDQKILTMNSLIMDEPFSVTFKGLSYQPENYQRGFLHRSVPVKEALASSLNIPAVKTIDLLTPYAFYQFLRSFDFKLPYGPDYYGHSLALGAADVTLYELVKAYQGLATGELQELSLTPSSSKKASVPLKAETRFILSHILSEKIYRSHTFGLDSILATSSWSAVKTGTSKDMRDNWCVGFTDRYVIGVWVGNSSGESMWNVTGISGAAPVFNHLVEYLHRHEPSKPPSAEKSLVVQDDNYYLQGTEPMGEEMKITRKITPKILNPVHESIYAFDPEIPEKNQHLRLEATGLKSVRWRLDGEILNSDLFPLKKAGRHLVELIDENQDVKDSVLFYVKKPRGRKQ
jgi:penicillin-binding protein 1C